MFLRDQAVEMAGATSDVGVVYRKGMREPSFLRLLASVIYHSDHLELSEQFDGVTGSRRASGI
jgi:hypothetical protein